MSAPLLHSSWCYQNPFTQLPNPKTLRPNILNPYIYPARNSQSLPIQINPSLQHLLGQVQQACILDVLWQLLRTDPGMIRSHAIFQHYFPRVIYHLGKMEEHRGTTWTAATAAGNAGTAACGTAAAAFSWLCFFAAAAATAAAAACVGLKW